jgi:hypothetical protein
LESSQRPRRYIAHHWLVLLRPIFRHSASRDAFVLRVVGNQRGPVLRIDRRRRPQPFEGSDRRGASVA